MKDYPEVPKGFDVVAFDLDGTLASKTWPSTDIGYMLPGSMDYILHYHERGYEIRVWTARPASHYPRIWSWLREHGLENVVYDVSDRKSPDVGLFFDDHAVYPPWL